MRNKMNNPFSIITLIIFLLSCQTKPTSRITNKFVEDNLIVPSDLSAFYFLLTSKDFSPYNNQDSFAYACYSRILYALQEPILYSYSGEKEIYRFTWIRSFDYPVSIRLQKKDDQINLVIKITDGLGGYDPGKIKLDTTISVDKEEWEIFKSLLKKAKFWEISTKDDVVGRDGSEWILEGIDNKKYHWATRWSPSDRDIDFKNVCEYLIKLTSINFESKLIY